MKIDFLFTFGDRVRIIPLEGMFGRIVTVYADARGRQYDVRYFNAGKEEVVRLLEDDLEAVR